MNKIDQLTSSQCCGCAACMDRCPAHAISMKEDNDGNRRAFIEDGCCIDCGQCARVCPFFKKEQNSDSDKKAYVAAANDKELTYKSSSGGIFTILAHKIIEKGGVVYGAAMMCENENIVCKHIRVDNFKQLTLLQGSKYVQSRTDGIYTLVKKDLQEGRLVLFSGTSCQVASIKSFIGNNTLLLTVDLVCHGVPKDRLFRDYITYLETDNQFHLIDISFRSKGKIFNGKEDLYALTLQGKTKTSNIVSKIIRSKKSAYCSLFFNKAGYRDSCYHCQYTTLQKPGDITLGDFSPRQNEIEHYAFDTKEHYSSIIVHTDKGAELIADTANMITATELPMKTMLEHHFNLKEPSKITQTGRELYHVYMEGGFAKLQKKINMRYTKYCIKTFIKSKLLFAR